MIVNSRSKGNEKWDATCWWPPSDSDDERRISFLISNFSEPDIDNWMQLPGLLIGIYNSLETAERELKKRESTLTMDSDRESAPEYSPMCTRIDIDQVEVEKLILVGKANSIGKFLVQWTIPHFNNTCIT